MLVPWQQFSEGGLIIFYCLDCVQHTPSGYGKAFRFSLATDGDMSNRDPTQIPLKAHRGCSVENSGFGGDSIIPISSHSWASPMDFEWWVRYHWSLWIPFLIKYNFNLGVGHQLQFVHSVNLTSMSSNTWVIAASGSVEMNAVSFIYFGRHTWNMFFHLLPQARILQCARTLINVFSIV